MQEEFRELETKMKTLPLPVRQYLRDAGVYLTDYVFKVKVAYRVDNLYFIGRMETQMERLIIAINPKQDLEKEITIETDKKFSYFRIMKNTIED